MISRTQHFITRFLVSWFLIMLYDDYKFPEFSFWYLLAHSGTAALVATGLVEVYIEFMARRAR